jgi:hypothetical protein
VTNREHNLASSTDQLTGGAHETPRAREERFDWPVCYEAENWILAQIEAFLDRNGFARELSGRMLTETGTLLIDWTDHLVLPASDELVRVLTQLGFRLDPLGEAPTGQRVYSQPEALLPRIILDARPTDGQPLVTLALRAEDLSDFMAAHGLSGYVQGAPLTRFRRLLVLNENGTRLEAIERRGYRGYIAAEPETGQIEALLYAKELWKTRQRIFEDDSAGFRSAHSTLDQVINLVGRDLACHVVFEGERLYWERRNRAARVQKQRQDTLGLGWANHDHHTFRSSREHFVDLMKVMEKLGFERRERYYAGSQAGWGAQILEQRVEGIVVFADVDLQPEETDIDFSRRPLLAATRLGTIGLWVGLHGESFLKAGMHHLEARFDFDSLREQLAHAGIQTMKPFSDFEFLKQAFTEGEPWPVHRKRADRLLRKGLITEEQFQRFLREGAIGSHLENLQRKGGFKGFNQKSVSAIIQATDPRRPASVRNA